jgi:hypothetical protein
VLWRGGTRPTGWGPRPTRPVRAIGVVGNLAPWAIFACAVLAFASANSLASSRSAHESEVARCATFSDQGGGLRWGVYVQDRSAPCSVAKRVLGTAEHGRIRILAGPGLFIRDRGWICRAAEGPIEWLCGRTRASLSAGKVDFFNLPCAPAGTCPRLARPRRFP